MTQLLVLTYQFLKVFKQKCFWPPKFKFWFRPSMFHFCVHLSIPSNK